MQILIPLAIAALAAVQQPHPRARDLGVPFEGTPGSLNAITDVAGVEVGFVTLIAGDGPLVQGKGPIRTGVSGRCAVKDTLRNIAKLGRIGSSTAGSPCRP